MAAHEVLRDNIVAARAAGRPALVAFLTAGYPKPDTFLSTLETVADIADAVEIGVPFSDPMADGVTIQRASHHAIANGVSLRWILDQLERLPRRRRASLLLFSYLNPLLRFGYDALARRAAEVGVSGFIIPDLPFEESAEFRTAIEPHGLGLVQLVTPATPQERMQKLCAASRGFVYAVTMTGVTGGGKTGLPTDLAAYLQRVRAASSLPVCAGFGVREAAQVRAIGGHADGVVVGSALVEVLERGEDPAGFLKGLRGE